MLRGLFNAILAITFAFSSQASGLLTIQLHSVGQNSTQYQVLFVADPSIGYALEFATELSTWQPIRGFPITDSEIVIDSDFSSAEETLFFRLRQFSSDASFDVREGLVLEYRFDESEGDIASDTSSSGLPGLLMGGAQWNNGYSGNGLLLDGVDDYVYVGDDDRIEVEFFTLCAWTKSDGETIDPLRQEILEKADSYWLNIRNDSRLVRTGGFFGDCSVRQEWFFADSHIQVEFGKWIHIASTYDGVSLRIFVNGELVSTRLVDRPICNDRDKLLVIGAKKEYDETPEVAQFSGMLDEVRIYNRPLSQSEIIAVMHAVTR